MNDTARGTGRTTRSVVLAIQHMLRGERVLVVAATQRQADEMLRIGANWLKENGWLDQNVIPITVHQQHRRITCCAVELTFHGYESFETLPVNRRAKVVWDHHALDKRAEREERLRRVAALEQIKKLMTEQGWTGVTTGNNGWRVREQGSGVYRDA